MGQESGKKQHREVTVAAILFAIIVGAVMNAAITYSGLKIGFTIVGSSIAAVLGFGILRGLLRKGSILEVNIAQTVASSVNTTNSGVIFTVPVLLLLGYQLAASEKNFWLLTLACMAGAVLGVAFIIPLRKQMIDIERLRFPSGTAVGAILKSPGAGAAKALVLGIGILLGALIFLPAGVDGLRSAIEVDELEVALEREYISPSTRELTLEIHGWIEAGEAPEELVELGRLHRELDELRRVRKKTRNVPLVAGRIGELEAQIAEYESAGEHPDGLLIGLANVADGEASWEDLKSEDMGWATKPIIPTYADLEWRVAPSEGDVVGEATEDLDGDGAPDAPLAANVDRNGDGRRDLIMTDHLVDVGRAIGLPGQYLLVFAIAPFALGAGYLSGRAGLMVLAGGVLAYLILNPILFAQGFIPANIDPWAVPGFARVEINRPLGIGLLLGGALMGVLVTLPSIGAALKSIAGAGKSAGGSDELGLKTVLLAGVLAFGALFATTYLSANEPINVADPVTGAEIEGESETLAVDGYTLAFESSESRTAWSDEWTDEERQAWLDEAKASPGALAGLPAWARALLVALIGALWMWFSGIIIAQCTGMTDWSPISGIALLTVVLVMVLTGAGNVFGAVLVGATLCVAITLAADMMSDLRSGYIVGATPKRQQKVELSTAWIGPGICMLTILLIAASNMEQFGIPMGVGTPTEAPQAEALRAVINGVQGGDLPYLLYGLGALLGLLLGLGSFAGLGVLVGLSMYLPFIYISTYGIGCIANIVVSKVMGKRWAEDWGVPLAAGLIVGEALLSLGINAAVLLRG